LIDSVSGGTVARITMADSSAELTVGSGKFSVRSRNALSVYRLADGHLLYRIPDLPHPPPGKGQMVFPPEHGRPILVSLR
jgi:hypothetical protein